MKKKLALFMAAIMSLTVVPVTSVFGANTVSIVPLGQTANEKEGVYDGSAATKGIAHFVDIELDEDVTAGSQFRAEIVGATFSHIDKGNNDYYSVFDPGEDAKDVTPRDEDGKDITTYRTIFLAASLPGVANGEKATFEYKLGDNPLTIATEDDYVLPSSSPWTAPTAPSSGPVEEWEATPTNVAEGRAQIRMYVGLLNAAIARSLVVAKEIDALQVKLYDSKKKVDDMTVASGLFSDLASAIRGGNATIIANVQKAISSALAGGNVYADSSKWSVTTLATAITTEKNDTLTPLQTSFDSYAAEWKTLEADAKNYVAEIDKIIDAYDEIGVSTVDMEALKPAKTDVTSTDSFSAIFGFGVANAGLGYNSEGNTRVVWSNVAYSGNKGISANQASAFVKKTADTKITVTIMQDIEVDTTEDVVIRIPLPIEIDDDAETVEFNITDGGGFLAKKQFLVVDTTAGGTTTTSDNAKGREVITLEDIRIEENAVGAIATGAIELTAPDGYRFKNRLNQVKIDTDPDTSFKVAQDKDNTARAYNYTNTGTWKSLVETKDIAWTDDNDQTSLALWIDVTSKSKTLTSAILIQGLVIEPLDDGAIVDNEELFMTISRYSESENKRTANDRKPLQKVRGNDGVKGSSDGANGVVDEIVEMEVTEEEFKVATAVDWAVVLTPEKVVELETGRWANDVDDDDHKTAELTLTETEKGGWLADRTTTFTLPEGVEIRGFKVTGYDNLNTDTDAFARGEFDEFFKKEIDLGMFEGPTGTDAADYGVADKEDFAQGKVSIKENVMSWKNIDIDTTDITEVKFELYLSIAPTFEGDEVTIELGGTAIVDEVEPVVVATVLHPIKVTTKTTDVQIGYQKYSVADIIIQENYAGAIRKFEDGLVVSMDNDKAEGLEIRGYDTMTIDGDIKLDDDAAKDSANNIVFDVVRESTTASTITLKGVEVYVDRTVPYGVYDVSVHGESVFANREGGALGYEADDEDAVTRSGGDADEDPALFARFADPYKAAYVNLATEGSYTPLKSHVVISDSNPVVMVDGVERTMTDVVPYRTTAEGGSFMVPVRFATEVFGIETKDTLWDDASGTFTIFTGGKTIQFIKNAGFYRINGVDVQMMTGDVHVYSEVDPDAGRMYIPFRHLGRALGIDDSNITFDDATGTAHYNQPREN